MRGPQIGERLRAALAQLESELRNLRATRESSAANLSQLAERRERLFGRLAEVYLPELGREAIDEMRGRLPAAHQRVQQLLAAKNRERGVLTDELEEHGRMRLDRMRQLDELTARVEELARERDQLAERVSRALAADPRHAELGQEVTRAQSRYEQSERRSRAAQQERDEKIPEYERDPLFGYLLRRHYGTDRYRGSGLTRRVDAWVAGKVDFTRQLQSYDLLREVPAEVERELAEHRSQLEAQRLRLRELEKQIEDLHGLTQVVEQGRSLYDQRQELIRRIEADDAEAEQKSARLEALETTRGQYYEQARDAVAELLESHPIPRLREIALSTASGRDDELAAELERWEREWQTAQQDIGALDARQRDALGRQDKLRKLDSRFRRQDYDASNSTFRQGFDIDELLRGFLAGALTLRALWRTIVSSQRFEPTRLQTAGPILETILIELARHAASGGWGSGSRRGGWGSRSGGGWGRTTGGFGGFGGGSRTTGGFG